LKEKIHRINPETEVEAHIKRLDSTDILNLFSDCDIIIEAFDRVEAKKMIIETVLSEMLNKFIISGNGMAGWGDSDEIKPYYSDRLIICGDMKGDVSETNPPLAPRVGIVSNMMANEALTILLKKK
jgi:sulfur carrier protein ThiS adenylyltransferase